MTMIMGRVGDVGKKIWYLCCFLYKSSKVFNIMITGGELKREGMIWKN
jgi:hypothetical protein